MVATISSMPPGLSHRWQASFTYQQHVGHVLYWYVHADGAHVLSLHSQHVRTKGSVMLGAHLLLFSVTGVECSCVPVHCAESAYLPLPGRPGQ